MNLDRHLKAHKDLFNHLVRGDGESAEKNREFYDEYLAVMDLTAEFYLQTVDSVFVRHMLPKGEMVHRGRRIDPAAIRRVALMTIEGEKDDITGVGQCAAAHDLCVNIPGDSKEHFVCPKVGHYGIFNGSRFRSEIAPRIAKFIRTHDQRSRTLDELAYANASAAAERGGYQNELASIAFTFSPANDCTPDPMVSKLKAQGLGSIAPRYDTTNSASGMFAAPYRIMALAGGLFLENLLRWNFPLSSGEPKERS